MRILFVTQLFDPENAIKGLAFASELVELGHDVEVLTAFPSYPGGKVFSGYKQKWRQVVHLRGVKVVRLPSYVSHGASAGRRLLSYFSFSVVAAFYALFFSRKADVIYCYYPPVVGGLMASVVSFLRRTPFVYDVQDLWPEALIATGNLSAKSKVAKIIEHACSFIYRRASRVVVLSQGYAEALVNKGVARSKLVKIYNWCDESRLNSLSESLEGRLSDFNRFNILYAGNLGGAQALEHVIEAAKILEQRGWNNIQFVFLGAGIKSDQLKDLAEEYGLSNVQFIGHVPVNEVGAYLASADVLLVHLAADPVFEITIPQKTQAYLFAGKPVLMAVNGEAASIISDAEAGIAIQPCCPVLLADAAIKFSQFSKTDLADLAERGKSYYSNNMSMKLGVQRVEKMLLEVVCNGTR